MPDYKMIYLCK